MFGLGNNEDEERLWNFVIFKIPMSDKEIEEASPWLGLMAVVIIVVIVVLLLIF